MAVLWTFRESSLCRHVYREFRRKAALKVTRRIPATPCHQCHDVERYRRCTGTRLRALARWGNARNAGRQWKKPLDFPILLEGSRATHGTTAHTAHAARQERFSCVLGVP